MSAIFVTGTGTDIGKTFVTAALLRHLRDNGVSASALKPVSSGYDRQHPSASDPGILLATMGEPVNEDSVANISPFRFAAPLAPNLAARREGKSLNLNDIVGFCRTRITAAKAPLLIEGVGGVMSPVAEGATGLDLMRALQCPALLVAGSYLGAISHALTAASVLGNNGIKLLAIVVNETPESTVNIDETCAELMRFSPRTPVVTMRRHDESMNKPLDAIAAACGIMS